jgi:hypothetical protein
VYVVPIFAYKLFNAPLDLGVCVCVSEAVFHSIQIRTKTNRSEEGRRKKKPPTLLVTYFIFFFHITINHKRSGRVFFWSIESSIKKRNENDKEKEKLLYIKKMKGVDRFCIYDMPRKHYSNKPSTTIKSSVLIV